MRSYTDHTFLIVLQLLFKCLHAAPMRQSAADAESELSTNNARSSVGASFEKPEVLRNTLSTFGVISSILFLQCSKSSSMCKDNKITFLVLVDYL